MRGRSTEAEQCVEPAVGLEPTASAVQAASCPDDPRMPGIGGPRCMSPADPEGQRAACDAQLGVVGLILSTMPASAGVRSPLR